MVAITTENLQAFLTQRLHRTFDAMLPDRTLFLPDDSIGRRTPGKAKTRWFEEDDGWQHSSRT
jgi:hypothetical protein